MIIAGPTGRARADGLPQARPARPWGRAGALLALLGAAAIVFVAVRVMSPFAVAPDEQGGAPAPAVRWSAIADPAPRYGFDGGPFARVAQRHAARSGADGGRIDDMTYGAFASADGRWLHLRIHRPAAALEPETAFFVAMARIASRHGLAVRRTALPELIGSGLGVMAVADLDVAGAEGEAACLGFRLRSARPAFELAGFACGAANRLLDRRELSCALDRLRLAETRADPELAAHFAAARPSSGASCQTARMAAPVRARAGGSPRAH